MRAEIDRPLLADEPRGTPYRRLPGADLCGYLAVVQVVHHGSYSGDPSSGSRVIPVIGPQPVSRSRPSARCV